MGCTDPGGFVLVSVLLVVAITSMIGVAAVMTTRVVRTDAALERRLVQATALADAGLTRIVAALEAADDPLSTSLIEGEVRHWLFASHEVSISLTPETAKVDLNAGDPDLVTNVLHAVIRDDGMADRLIRRLAVMRRARQDLETVRSLLDPGNRTGPLARELESIFTVWTGLRGVNPIYAPSIVLRHLPGLQEGEATLLEQARKQGGYASLSPFITQFGTLLQSTRPIYRARAEVIMNHVTVRREALLVLNQVTRVVSVVFWRDVFE